MFDVTLSMYVNMFLIQYANQKTFPKEFGSIYAKNSSVIYKLTQLTNTTSTILRSVFFGIPGLCFIRKNVQLSIQNYCQENIVISNQFLYPYGRFR